MTVFVDVDDTLVIFETDGIHPYGVIRGEPYEPNYILIEKLKNVNDDRIIVWSGGGTEYARTVARAVLLPAGIRCVVASKFDDFKNIKPGDIIVDDQKEYYTAMKEAGVHVFGPFEDWNLKEV